MNARDILSQRDANGRIVWHKPAGAITVACKESGAYVYLYTDVRGLPCARGFTKRAEKPVFRFYFKNEEARKEHVSKWLKEQAERKAKKVATRKIESQPHDVKVGTIFVYSWGYEQTNIDYFEVVSATPKGVYVREIASRKIKETGWLQGQVIPVAGDYIGEKEFKRVKNYNGTYSLSMDHGWCGVWDGRPNNYTAYA